MKLYKYIITYEQEIIKLKFFSKGLNGLFDSNERSSKLMPESSAHFFELGAASIA